jgi:hypothetical protein
MDELIQSIYDSPQDWKADYATFRHKPSNIPIWTGNGLLHVSVYQIAL